MTHDRKRTPEGIATLLGGFEPAEPGADTDERILRAAGAALTARRRRPFAALAGLSTLAAAVCFAVFLATRPSPPAAKDSHDLPAVAVLEEEVVLSVLARYRSSLDDIGSMLQLVPERKEAQRERIRAKLDHCLERLTRLENRVRRKPGNTWLPETNRKEVRV